MDIAAFFLNEIIGRIDGSVISVSGDEDRQMFLMSARILQNRHHKTFLGKPLVFVSLQSQ
jgi:hypothetical protein